MKRIHRTTAALVGLAMLAAIAGCAGRRAQVNYHDPNMDFSLIQTVAVLPFENLSDDRTAGEAVRDVFMTMLQATGAVYVLPPGEIGRGISRLSLSNPSAPTTEEAVRFADIVDADVLIAGTVLEYGELRSAGNAANAVSLSVMMLDGRTGTVVWRASASEGGIKAAQRVFGGGGRPMENVLRKAVSDLLDKLFE